MAGSQAHHQHEIAFEAFGVRAAVSSNRPELLDRLRRMLPPGWQPCPSESVETRFALTTEDAGTCELAINGNTMSRGLELDLALTLVESQLRLFVGIKAPDAIFVHAGVVAHDGRAIALPGPSFAGKTTLVAALVAAGLTYFSDEFAVIDSEGLVHPYPKPLSVRTEPSERQTDHQLESLGWTAGANPLPLGMIVVTSYRVGVEWTPQRRSAGAGAMALLANTVPARDRPEQVMSTLRRAAESAMVLEGERGEAEPVASSLLRELESAPR